MRLALVSLAFSLEVVQPICLQAYNRCLVLFLFFARFQLRGVFSWELQNQFFACLFFAHFKGLTYSELHRCLQVALLSFLVISTSLQTQASK